MNKPFEVCLRLVLPLTAEALAKAVIVRTEAAPVFAKASAGNKGKGQLQTGIEDLLKAHGNGKYVLTTLRGTNRLK